MMTDKEDKQYKLSVLAKTWARDSHGLYDYETTSMKITNIDISFNLIRFSNDVNMILLLYYYDFFLILYTNLFCN